VAHCFGDHALAQRALLVALGTQNESGWFQGQGVSGLNSDEPTEMLWAAVFLRDHYLYAGDDEFLRQSFEPIEEALRYHAKAVNRHGLLDGGNWPVFRQGQGVYLDDVQLSGPYLGFFPGELTGDNILYAAALAAAATLAAALGLEERAAFYARKAARVRRAINGRLWDPRAPLRRLAPQGRACRDRPPNLHHRGAVLRAAGRGAGGGRVTLAPRPGEEGSVGHVRATITVANRLDQALVERGELDAAEARSATFDGV